MKIIITKPFRNLEDDIWQPLEIREVWSDTAARAIAEGKALEVPDGADEALFRESVRKQLTTKNKKGT